jgi:2'-hydroxyisoflavone reductase
MIREVSLDRSRRDFLFSTASAGSLLALPIGCSMFSEGSESGKDDPPARSLNVLILGGTGFIGPEQVDALRARGHTVTLFNRGRRNPELFPDVEKLRGDRDPNKDQGLTALQGRKWDVVFDNSGYYPRMVKASAELLAPNCGQYVFVSSISVYADNSTENADETAAVGTMPDPTLESMGPNFEYYGPLKALCEQAVEAAFPGRATIVRPGYIVGPNDPTDRFTYWPVRVAKGGEMLAPGAPSDPVQVIDARDLGEWMTRIAENGTTGVFNACGPKERTSMEAMLEACKKGSGADTTFTWVPTEFLQAQGGADGLPIWIPYSGDTKGFHTWSNARAVAAGLTFRPLEETASDTLAWWNALPEDRRNRENGWLKPEKEAELLEAWKKSQES